MHASHNKLNHSIILIKKYHTISEASTFLNSSINSVSIVKSYSSMLPSLLKSNEFINNSLHF